MINLIPPDVKESFHYARRNTRLVRWVVAMGLACTGLVGISIGGIWYLRQTAQQYQEQVAAAESELQLQNQKAVEKETKDIGDSLKLAVQVLSNEVLFSQLLKQMAIVTPDNATLSNLTISPFQGQIQGAIDISANTADYNAATQLQINLADPANKIFSKADIVSINCTAASGATTSAQQSRYPCAVTIRALFADNNPFLFINGTAKATP